MRKSEVIKSHSLGATPEEMEMINKYTRRPYTADEVYVFSVILCDNDIDRDFERFTVEALFEMEKLFVGKTGICDHNPKALNQSARLFDCKVEARQDKKTLTGDEYFCLVGRAYMPKTPENEPLISRIESGICKEVSVGLSAKSRVCSVCSSEDRGCNHIPGHTYSGKLCYFELSQINDAYEWSFVAVPAQREAGVVKCFENQDGKEIYTMKDIMKNLESADGVVLSVEDSKRLLGYIKRLEKRASAADEMRDELEQEVLRLSVASESGISKGTMKNALCGLSVSELREFAAVFRKRAEKVYAPKPQLSVKKDEKPEGKNTEFRI